MNACKINQFKELLKAHDFYYKFSDDHGVFIRGNAEYRRLLNMMKELPVNELVLAVEEFVPKELKEDWLGIICTIKP